MDDICIETMWRTMMGDTTVKKVDSHHSPNGKMGQKYLASGQSVSMRLWVDLQPETSKETRSREYETVGYAIKGRAELDIEGQRVLLNAGDSWVVPKGSRHSFAILEAFTAVEATTPPAHVHGRDE
jgi:quercetin dioxygenase-like cupin family protein